MERVMNSGICRCCASEGSFFKDLSSKHQWMGEDEVYADMLRECFDISLQMNESSEDSGICEVCITQLRNASNFKKQVLQTEENFRKGFTDRLFKNNIVKVEVNQLEYDVHVSDDNNHSDDYSDEEYEVPIKSEVDESKGKKRKKATTTRSKKPKVEAAESSKSTARTKASVKAKSKSSMTPTKRNHLIKRNTISLIENSTITPFKWHNRENYRCFYCRSPFKDFQSLKEHTNTNHRKSNIKTAVSYLRSDEKAKIEVSTLDCKCGDSFEELNHLIDHLKADHNIPFTEGYGYGVVPYRLTGDSFHCALCKKEFQYFVKLNQHMNKHYASYFCEMCDKSFLSKDRLRSHSLKHGSGYKCNVCSERFNTLIQRNNHETKVHNKDKTIKCLFCSETFPNYNARKKHHHAVHNMELTEFKCPECGKIFHVMNKMKVHLKEVHLKEKNFACAVCGNKFFSKTHVKKHMVIHLGEKAHQCLVCKKSFTRKHTLKNHEERMHSHEKLFECSVCNKKFDKSSGVKLHLKLHHQESTTD